MKTAALAVLFTALLAAPAHAGPPRIRADLRGHPTAGGFITLTTFHHTTQMPMELRGTAEGLVDGRRTSVALRFDAVPGEAGVYVVPRTWGEAGVWVLNVGTAAEHGGAGVVVGVDRNGRPAWQQTPRTYEGLSRRASAGEVTALLAALDAGRPVPELQRADLLGLFRRNGPPLGFLGLTIGSALWLTVRLSRRIAARMRGRATVAA